jgi:hypothetical protein
MLTAGVAQAQNVGCPASPPTCASLTSPVYVVSADTQVPFLHRLGRQMASQATNPQTIVYFPAGSCQNLVSMYAASGPTYTPTASGGGPYYVPSTTVDATFDVTLKTGCQCTLPSPNTVTPDLASVIVFPDNVSCPTSPVPPAGKNVVGPVQAMTFVVPYDTATNVGSSQKAITAEEAYLVMGLGAANAQVTPWGDPNFIYGRPASKGTQVSIGANIHVPAAKWQLIYATGGKPDEMHTFDQSSSLATAVANMATDPNAEKVLGILGAEIYDKAANRAKMHSLAFRAFQQLHAYWPDKTATSFDKQNVRDGHYLLWSYVQYLEPAATAVSAGAQMILDAIQGKPLTGASPESSLDLIISVGLVPQCAMKVQRSVEGGDLSLAPQAEPCGCYYESKVPGGSTSCTPCTGTDNTPCGGGVCRHNFCEAN